MITYEEAKKWYTHGIIDTDGSIGDGIDADFYDQYGDQFQSPSTEVKWQQGVVLRPVVKWFAEQMELALIKNDHKSGWLNDDWDELYDRIKDEMKELKKECEKFTKDDDKIIAEAADIANFAMMIADLRGEEFGQHKPSQPQEAGQDELWEIIKEDIKNADKAYVPLKLIVKWKKQFALVKK